MSEAVAAPTHDNNAAGAGTTAADDAMKVFAGNLAFATTEEELQAVFAEAGKVKQAQIIKRGTRSLGYGFVTYETEAEAQKAVQLLNKKEISGREINVEGAKPQSDLAKHNDSGNYTVEGEDGAVRGGRGRGRGRGRAARGRGGATARRPRADDGEEELEDPIKENGAQEGGAANGGLTKTARRRQKKAAAKQAEANGETPAPAAAVATKPKEKAPREPRTPKGPPRGEPSKTLLFVANLPFTFTDEQLKAAFDGFQVKTATVVKRRFGTRTKGFGFVDLENEGEQQRALKEIHGKEVEGRELQLKVAIQGDDQKEGGEVAASTEALAAPAA